MQRTCPPQDLAPLWSRWFEGRSATDRDALVEAYLGLVRILAAKCYAKRITQGLEFGDYLQFGIVGLLESIDRFDASSGVRFETFAGYRIQGAILNGVEDLTEVQKQISVRSRIVRERSASLAHDKQRSDEPAIDVLARTAIGLALGFALEDAGMYLAQDDQEPALPDNAYSRLELKQLKKRVAESVEALPPQQRAVVHRHYFQQLSFSEIADSMKLTKGRVSQIHSAAIQRLAAMQREQVEFRMEW